MVLALAMNRKVREVSVYRAVYYLPSILPLFAISFIFVVLLNPGYGLVNWVLSALGLPSPNWLGDPAYTKLALVLIAQLGAGQFALVFLAGLAASRSSCTNRRRSTAPAAGRSSATSPCR